MSELPMSDVYWPFGLAALHDEHLARPHRPGGTGQASWGTFSSLVETGNVEVHVDIGCGCSEANKAAVPVGAECLSGADGAGGRSCAPPARSTPRE